MVDYDSRKAYERAHSSDMFIVYKSIVIGLFLLAMFNEFKACVLTRCAVSDLAVLL